MSWMPLRLISVLLVSLAAAVAQQSSPGPNQPAKKTPARPAPADSKSVGSKSQGSQNQPSQNNDPAFSSSRDNIIDLSPPPRDAKDHPDSANAVDDVTGIQEFHPWNPMRAMKNVEVGDFYFKRKNYHAALARYQEALLYKPKDAIATLRLAQCEEKIGSLDDAREHYGSYLVILPDGPSAEEAKTSLERLKSPPPTQTVGVPPKS
jgi:tetratricopeptide (TPR) repeat protein